MRCAGVLTSVSSTGDCLVCAVCIINCISRGRSHVDLLIYDLCTFFSFLDLLASASA